MSQDNTTRLSNPEFPYEINSTNDAAYIAVPIQREDGQLNFWRVICIKDNGLYEGGEIVDDFPKNWMAKRELNKLIDQSKV